MRETGFYFVKRFSDSAYVAVYWNDSVKLWYAGFEVLNEEPQFVHPERIQTPDEKTAKPFDEIQKPAHYTDSNIEVIDYIEDKKLGFKLGNCVKYISRAGKKEGNSRLKDLQKAKWYLDREVANESILPL